MPEWSGGPMIAAGNDRPVAADLGRNARLVFRAPVQVGLEACPAVRPEVGEALVETCVSLISAGTELVYLRGEAAWLRLGAAAFPYYPGYSSAGRVLRSRSPDGPTEGARVFALAPHQRRYTAAGRDLRPVPARVSDEEAAFAALGAVASYGVERAAVGPGECTVVWGLGLVGQLTAQLLRVAGAARVIVVDRHPERVALALRHGADVGVEAGREDPVGAIGRATDGRGAACVVDTTGAADALLLGFRVASPGGRVVLLGGLHRPATLDLFPEFQAKDLSLVSASHGVSTAAPGGAGRHRAARFLDLLAGGAVDVAGLVTHRVAWFEAERAYRLLQERHEPVLGVLLQWVEALR